MKMPTTQRLFNLLLPPLVVEEGDEAGVEQPVEGQQRGVNQPRQKLQQPEAEEGGRRRLSRKKMKKRKILTW